MSLQNNPVRAQFVAKCRALWTTWNVGPQAGRPAARQLVIQQALTTMTNFMHPPTLKFKTINDWGSFQWSIWTLKLKKQSTEDDDIKYWEFVEFCSTIYHETRHAEQFYRIAQGLALGRLHYPDATQAEVINQLAVPAGGGGVQAKMAMFGGGGRVAATPALPTATLLSTWLKIPQGAAQHAHASSAQFDTFTALTKPSWFQRRTNLLEVEEWMRATYKKTYRELDSFAQNEDDYAGAVLGNVYNMYRNLPEEHDAHSIEELVQSDLKALIGHAGQEQQPRSNVTIFGP